MGSWLVRLLLCTSLAATTRQLARADDLSTAASPIYPALTATCRDWTTSGEILQMGEDARTNLAGLIQLGPEWRFPVHITVLLPGDPGADQLSEPRVAVIAGGSHLQLEVMIPGERDDLHEIVERQFVTALLWEKIFPLSQRFDAQTRLDRVPFWLSEGLREWLDSDTGRDRQSIVRRAQANGLAPTLDEVTGWQSLSPDRLLGLWQKAFCFYLVESLVNSAPRLEQFQLWLRQMAGPNPQSAEHLFPTEAGWQRELTAADFRSHDLIYTWEQTEAELALVDAIPVTAAPNRPAHNFTLDSLEAVANRPLDPLLLAAFARETDTLTRLELRANPSWRSPIAEYRFALTALCRGNRADADRLLARARRDRIAELARHQQLLDYANWFDFKIAKDNGPDASSFRSYFNAARETDQAEADPQHPNALRAAVLRIESQ